MLTYCVPARFRLVVTLLLAALGLLVLACGPSATPTPAPTSAGPEEGVSSLADEPIVIPVNQQIEQAGITVGVNEVAITGQAVTVNYWRDCGLHHLEPMDPAVLLVAGEPVSGTGGGGGDPCDSSQVWQMTFPPLPTEVERFSFRHGNIMGDSPEFFELELPLGQRLSELDPAFGGEAELDLVAESRGLAYRFAKVSMGIDRFTLDLQPANQGSLDRPLGSPQGEIFIEDDLGNEYPGGRRSAGFHHPEPLTLVWEDERLEFRGHLDTQASTWRLRAPNLGQIYRGPWQFDFDIPAGIALPTPAPTATPTLTLKPTQRAAVTPTATPGPDEPTRLMQAMNRVPLEFSNQQITFADFAASRAATRLADLRSIEDFGRPGMNIQRLYEGLPALPSQVRSNVVSLREHTGLELFLSDLGIWSLRNNQETGSTFLLLQGRYPRDTVGEKLLALEYQPVEHQETTYYRLSEDYVMDIRHPLRTTTLLLNRVALVDDWMMAAPATNIMESLIDVQVGDAPTLLDSPTHRVLAESAGRDLIGGAFITPGWVMETWDQYYGQRPLERLDRYTSGPDRWGRLSPYTVGLMGYQAQNRTEEVVIALYYPDPQAARRDSEELKKRWRTFHQDITTSGPVEEPVARYCSPMTTGIIEEDDYSVLVGTCPVIREEGPGAQAIGPSLWAGLLEVGELPFLALDLDRLRAAAEQRRANDLATQEALREKDK